MTEMTSYLKENIGAVVSSALQELTRTQPADPVEFVGKYLKEYVASEKTKRKQAEEKKRIAESRTEYQNKQSSEKKTAEAAAGDLARRMEKMRLCFDAPHDWPTHILPMCKETLKAENASFGSTHEGGEEAPDFIAFEHALGDTDMVSQQLPRDQGVTWKCFDELAQPEDYEGDDWKKYRNLYLPDILRKQEELKPGPHFFKEPQSGAFLAVPLVYESYLTSEAVEASRAYDIALKEKKKKEEEKEEEEKGEPEEPEPKEIPSVVQKRVMIFDTLGTKNTFSKEAIEEINALVDIVLKEVPKAEYDMVCKQTELELDDALKESNEEQFKAFEEVLFEDVTYHIDPQVEKYAEEHEGEPMPDEEKEALREQLDFDKNFALLKLCTEGLLNDIKSKAFIRQEMLDVLVAAAFFVGFTKSDVLNDITGKPSQSKGKKIAANLLAKVQENGIPEKIRGPRLGLEKPYQKLEYIKGMIPGEFSPEDVTACSRFFSPFYDWLKTAVEMRTKDVAARKEAAEKVPEPAEGEAAEAAEGEEGGEAPPPPEPVNLAEIDDDFIPLEEAS